MNWFGFCVGLVATNVCFALQVAFYSSAFWLVWVMFGSWSLVPLLLAPLAVFASFWLFSDVVGWSFRLLYHALEARALEIDFGQFDVGPAARTSVGAVFGLVLLLFGAGMMLWDPGVASALLLFCLIVGSVIAAGAVPALLLSGLGLTRAYVVRVRRRHRKLLT